MAGPLVHLFEKLSASHINPVTFSLPPLTVLLERLSASHTNLVIFFLLQRTAHLPLSPELLIDSREAEGRLDYEEEHGRSSTRLSRTCRQLRTLAHTAGDWS
ncbi:MAG: hypothetical protein M1816_003342 [Peltula sp. TS41687]|nr:MAG: hypothetical protein M1816_003342 [Peltula sp. TS41687]